MTEGICETCKRKASFLIGGECSECRAEDRKTDMAVGDKGR